jgi:hypothetical protein
VSGQTERSSGAVLGPACSAADPEADAEDDPAEPGPTEPSPTEPGPTEPGPTEPGPIESSTATAASVTPSDSPSAAPPADPMVAPPADPSVTSPNGSGGSPAPVRPPTGGARPSATNPPDADRRAPGGVIAGRYRLLEQVGADTSVPAEFWRARDTVLERDVALTLLPDTGERDSAPRAADMISRGLRWGRFEHIGCARLLDVMRNEHGGLPKDVHGLAVTEWVPGKNLAEAVAAGPLRTGAVLRMLEPLAHAAEAAHRQGLVLGCAHPRRVRFTPEGGARLAFALPHPDATPAQDVRGLGALLYALLTGHWPLTGTDAELAGLPPAPRDPQDVVVAPAISRPGVSVEVSALATGALGAGATHGRVHTAAAVHTVISELLESDAYAALLPPPDDGAPADDDEVWHPENVTARHPDPGKKRKLSIGMGGLGLGMLAVIGYVGVQLGSLLGVAPPSPPKIVVTSPPQVTAKAAPPPAAPPGPPPVSASPQGALTPLAPLAIVPVASAQVYDPTGDPDNPGRLNRAFDNDPSSGWSTYDYRSPFPALKPGVGIMVSFAAPVQLAALTIGSPSNGTELQIRSAPSPTAQFAQTVQIGAASITQASTTVSLSGSQPVQNVLLWITKLGGGGADNVTQLNDLRFERPLD